MDTIFDPTVINIDVEAIDEPFEYLDQFFDQIKNINITDFNFDIFEKYITELSDADYVQLYDSKIKDILTSIDDSYLTVDIDEFDAADTEANKVMFVKYIEFLMDTLPYKIVFAEYIKKPFNTLSELEDWLADKNISEDLAKILESHITIINNMYNLIKTTIKMTKKPSKEYQQRADKLKYYLDYENNFKDYFIGLIEDTDNERLKNLILKYYGCEYV